MLAFSFKEIDMDSLPTFITNCHWWDRHGHDPLVIGFTITYAITTSIVSLKPLSLRWVVLSITLCDKVCQWIAAGRWFSPGTQVSSTNKSYCDDISEILLKVALNIIALVLSLVLESGDLWTCLIVCINSL